MQNRGTCCLKKVFKYGKIKGKFYARKSKKNSIVNENALNSEGAVKYNKVRPSNYLFQLFLTL